MIHKIDGTNFNDIYEILIEYGREIRKDEKSEATIDKYNELISDPDNELYFYTDNKSLQGMCLININESMMYNFYMKGSSHSSESEIEFFDWVFNYLKSKTGGFVSQYPLFSSTITNHMTNLGIEFITRHVMSISTSKVNELSEPILDDQYNFVPWDDKYVHKSTELTVNAYDDTLDARIFPFFQQIEGSKEFITNVSNNNSGKFDKNIETLLLDRDELIGLCLITIDETKGFIPSVVILSERKGLGLGKSLIIHSMKDLIKHHEIDSIGLVVTENNSVAFTLYTKIGFESFESGTTYVL